MVFLYNANAFAGLVLVAHRSSLANAQARFFILCYIDFFFDLTKKLVGGILKERDDGVYELIIHTANGWSRL